MPTIRLLVSAPGRTGNHALAAGDAGGFSHGQIVIEGDSGLVALAATGQHPVVADVIAAANASVA